MNASSGFSSFRLNRRQLLTRFGLAGLGVGVLAIACGPSAPPAAAPTTAAPAAAPTTAAKPAAAAPTTAAAPTVAAAAPATQAPAQAAPTTAAATGALKQVPRNQTLVVMQGGANGQNPDFANFNIRTPGGAVNGWHSGALQTMAEPLIMFNVLTGEYENWLAESWQYNTDFTELNLKLRKGIEWTDGTPFTSKDVVFTFNTVRDHQDKMVHTAEINFLKEAQAVDDLTVNFVLNKPNPRWWATTLTSNHGVVEQFYPETVFKDQDPVTFTFYDPAKGWPIGTGPYKLVQSTAQQKVFDLNPGYWGAKTGFKPLPKVQRIIVLPSQDDTLATQRLINNEIDMCKIVPVPTLKSAFAQNPKVVTFTGQEAPYGYTDWCPISVGFNDSAAPFDKAEMRQAINFAIDRTKLVNLAESGAGVLAYHQFTPYVWFQKFDEAIQPTQQKYGLDGTAHLDKVSQLMGQMGYTKGGDGLWADASGQKPNMKIAVPDWLKNYGPPLSQQLRDAGFDATFDTSPGLDSQVQTGDQPLYFNCQGPAGVKGMDPYFMLSIFTSQYYRPTGQPAPISWATSRYRNPAYDDVVEKISPLSVDDPKTLDYFGQAMDLWFKDLPMVYVSQLIIRYPMNTTYWTGWPSKDKPYGFPHSWQQELMKTIFALQPTGAA
jgi:peptide/nickel transport system substrate-binding protein